MHYRSQPGRPRALLEQRHAPALAQLLAEHPQLSLRKLCPLVRQALALPSMNEATLNRFIRQHSLPRSMPKGMAQRSAARQRAS